MPRTRSIHAGVSPMANLQGGEDVTVFESSAAASVSPAVCDAKTDQAGFFREFVFARVCVPLGIKFRCPAETGLYEFISISEHRARTAAAPARIF